MPDKRPLPLTKNISRVGTPTPQGMLGNIADAWMLDTGVGQFIQKADLEGMAAFFPDNYDPNFNPFNDPRIDVDQLPSQLLNELAGTADYDDALSTIQMYNENIDRARRIDEADAGVTRFLTGFLDPVNLIPVPLAVGRGFLQGFKRTLAPNLAILTASESVRSAIDPTDTAAQTVANIGFGTLMGSTLGGLFGMVPKNAMQLSKQVSNYMNIRERANELGPDAPGPSLKELDLNARWDAIKDHYPGAKKSDVIRGTADDGLGDVIRLQSMRTGDEPVGRQVFIRQVDEEGMFELVELVKGKQKSRETGTKQELIEKADTFSVKRVDNFYSREAVDQAQIHIKEAHPERPVDAEGQARYDDDQIPYGAAKDSDGATIHEGDGHTTRYAFRDLMDSDRQHFQESKDTVDAAVAQREAELEALKKPRRGEKGRFVPRETAEIDRINVELIALRARQQKVQQHLDETNARIELAEESNNPADYMLTPTGIGLEKLYGKSQMFPFFSLTETKLVKLAPDLAPHWQRIAYRLAGSPGLQYRGGKRGVSVGTSAEMQAIGWWNNFREAKVAMDGEYARLYGFGEKVGPTRFAVQEIKEGAVRAFGLKDRDVSQTGEGLSFAEFRNEVGDALINGGKVSKDGMESNVRTAVENSANAWRQFFNGFRDEGARLGVFQTQEALARRITRKREYIDNLSGKLAEFDTRTAGGKRIVDAMIEKRNYQEMQLDLMESQLEFTKGMEGSGDWLSDDYFFRIWLPEEVKANETAFKEILRTHFKNNPQSYTYGKKTKRSENADAIEVRVDETYDNIIGESEMDDALGMADTLRGQREIQGRIDSLNDELEELVSGQIFPDAEVTIKRGPITEDIKKPRIGEDGEALDLPAAFRRTEHIDGVDTDVIYLDRARLKEMYKSKPWKNPKVKGVLPLAFEFRSPHEWASFVLAHEKAHVVHRQKPKETTAQYENRINQLGLDEFKAARGKVRDLEYRRKERLIDQYGGVLERPDQIGHVMPAPLRSRALDIHNTEVSKFIERDIDVVAQRYLNKVAPVIEITRNFGDRNVADYRIALNQDLNERIHAAYEAGDDAAAVALEKEQKIVNDSVDNLRDMVLGNFGLSKNPAHWTGRATRLATAWMNLTGMGKVIFSALNDAGNFVGYVGFKRAMGDAWRFSLARVHKDANEWNVGRLEAEWAGEAANIWNAARARAMTDIGGQNGFGKFEKGVMKHQDRLFIFNLLTPWTDFMEGMTGTMAQSSIIRDALAIVDGTMNAKRLGEVAKLGMTKSLAKNIAKEWRALPEEMRQGKHLYLANSDKWKDKSVQRAFRAMLATEINNLVPAPKAADRPTFMHTNWGRVMFQYKGFGFAATSKIMMANLQRKDARALSTMMSMIGISYITDLMRQPDFISLDFDEQLLRAVERSAITGLLLDVNQMVESASDNELGIRPMFGMDSFERDVSTRTRFGEALGPSVNQWSTFAAAFLDDDAETADKTRALRYIIPYNNLLYYSSLIDRLQRGATNALE